MPRDPNGVPPENRTVRRYVQGPPNGVPGSPPRYPPVAPPPPRHQPVEPPPPRHQPVEPPPPPLAPRRPDLDPDRWGFGAAYPPPAPAAPPPVPAPTPPRRGPGGRGWVALVIAILVAAAAVVVTIVLTSGGDPKTSASPSSVVTTYLRDLASSDAAGALAQGAPPRQRYFLTDAILRQQQHLAPISGISVGSARIDGDEARVRAQYRFGSRAADTTYDLSRDNGRWRLNQTTFRIKVSNLAGIPSVTVFDKPVGGVQAIDVFPGPVVWGSGNKYFAVTQSNSDRYALSPTDPDASYAEISTDLNSDGVAAVRAAASAYVKVCAASKSLKPPKCPQSEFGLDGAVKNTASWTLTTPLNAALRVKLGDEVITTLTVQANLRWTCVYSARAARGKTKRVTDRAVTGPLTGSVDLTAAKPAFTAQS